MLNTERLILRAWRDADCTAFAAMNADPVVMRFFPAPLAREQSDALLAHIRSRMAEQGFGLWAVEEKHSGECCGFVGLNCVGAELPFAPAVEISWRLAQRFQGQCYATEAAQCALEAGFHHYKLAEIVSFTTLQNLPSQRVMEKLGMTRCGEFDHPLLPAGHPLMRHVLYRKASG
ncbi:GNAT family N-acetyltransferase [Enterobacteriaceae bacterium 4M9]|nr:GNAT family N-acetyltransferase [Enterobacteriaceae bacterium 4M9]